MVSDTQVKQRRHCARPIEALHRLTLAHHPAGAKNEIWEAAATASCVQKGASKKPLTERNRSFNELAQKRFNHAAVSA